MIQLRLVDGGRGHRGFADMRARPCPALFIVLGEELRRQTKVPVPACPSGAVTWHTNLAGVRRRRWRRRRRHSCRQQRRVAEAVTTGGWEQDEQQHRSNMGTESMGSKMGTREVRRRSARPGLLPPRPPPPPPAASRKAPPTGFRNCLQAARSLTQQMQAPRPPGIEG